MNKTWMGTMLLVGAGIIAAIILHRPSVLSTKVANMANVTSTVILNTNTVMPGPKNTSIVPAGTNTAANPTASPVVIPITDFYNRITKKPFGIYITPKTSPIQPEKFSGYHTGADAETTAAEKDIDIPVVAIADGTMVFAGHVNGYGGVIIVRHTINGETVTALYGHLRISSFMKKNGDPVKIGEQVAILGTGFSSETDGERKHLHFGLIKGTTINYRGYVQAPGALSAWEDPMRWLVVHLANTR